MNIRTIQLLTLMAASACGKANPGGDPARVTIQRGATLTAVAETLSARGVVRSSRLFRVYATLTGKQHGIQAGTYEFRQDMSMRKALEILVSGREALERLVLPEGLMLREVAERVYQQLGISTVSFLDAARDSGLREQLGITGQTVEGYLYPSTYYVRINATAEEVVRQIANEFESRWRPEWNARLDTLGMTRHEIVIIASIIEGEIRYDPDRKFVSSVYHNRLARGMRLQADPTVIYALGRRRRLFQQDYQFPSPYNTYLIDGLPPGPISQPSAASLEAALFPAATNYLYFVARPDGMHVFSPTLREHQSAVREVRRSEAELGLR